MRTRERIWQIMPSYSGYKLIRDGIDIFHTDYNLPDVEQLKLSVLAAGVLNDIEEGCIALMVPPKKGESDEG